MEIEFKVKERKGKERKGQERKGKERKGKESQVNFRREQTRVQKGQAYQFDLELSRSGQVRSSQSIINPNQSNPRSKRERERGRGQGRRRRRRDATSNLPSLTLPYLAFFPSLSLLSSRKRLRLTITTGYIYKINRTELNRIELN